MPVTCERTSAPRSITEAIFSSPAQSLMPSTAVSMAGNVLSTSDDFNPFSNGVCRFGSNVSVCAIPPAIQRTSIIGRRPQHARHARRHRCHRRGTGRLQKIAPRPRDEIAHKSIPIVPASGRLVQWKTKIY
jgi:hypothetical protein